MPDSRIMLRLYEGLRPFLKPFVTAVLLYIPVTLLSLAQPLVIGAAVEHGFQTRNLSQVEFWAAIYLLVVILYAAAEMAQTYLMQFSGQKLVNHLRKDLFAKVQRLPMSTFDHTPLGKILTRITSDVEAVAELFSSGAVAILGDLLFLTATLLMLFLVNAKLSLSTMMVLPLLAVGLVFFRRWTRTAYMHVRVMLSSINGFLQEYLSGMPTVQLFNQVKRAEQEFSEHNANYMLANRRAIFLDSAIYSFVDAASFVTVAAVLWVGMGLRQHGALGLGVMVTFVEALNRFFQPIRELANNYAVVQSALVSGERIVEFLDQPEENVQSILPFVPVFKREIAFENVSFSYGHGSQVLHEVNFKIEHGQRIALVGHTGAGKTTVTKLLTRMYDATHGAIRIDGVDVRDFDLRRLRGLFNVVPQEVFLFQGTLRDNLRYGRMDASDDDILQAVHLCQADELLARAGGLDGALQVRATNLSLGERQLLVLARALIANPQILILDEATASIDTETERRLQVATKNLLANRTSVTVAHRLSTIVDSDRILVFHKGRLVEQGDHHALLLQNGIYAKLIELQKSEFALRPTIVPDASDAFMAAD